MYGMYWIGDKEEKERRAAEFNVLRKLAKKQKRSGRKIIKKKKVYATNPDTISLNCDKFCPDWIKPRDSSFDPRLVLGAGLKRKKRR